MYLILWICFLDAPIIVLFLLFYIHFRGIRSDLKKKKRKQGDEISIKQHSPRVGLRYLGLYVLAMSHKECASNNVIRLNHTQLSHHVNNQENHIRLGNSLICQHEPNFQRKKKQQRTKHSLHHSR